MKITQLKNGKKISFKDFANELVKQTEHKNNYQCNLDHVCRQHNYITIYRADIDGETYYSGGKLGAYTDLATLKREISKAYPR